MHPLYLGESALVQLVREVSKRHRKCVDLVTLCQKLGTCFDQPHRVHQRASRSWQGARTTVGTCGGDWTSSHPSRPQCCKVTWRWAGDWSMLVANRHMSDETCQVPCGTRPEQLLECSREISHKKLASQRPGECKPRFAGKGRDACPNARSSRLLAVPPLLLEVCYWPAFLNL